MWIHLLPPAPEDPDLKELRETTTALAPDGDRGVYVGTLDGLWYAGYDGDPAGASWTRLADGPVFSVAVLEDESLVAGFTTVVQPEDLEGGTLADVWGLASAPFLHLDVAGTPGDSADDDATWLVAGDATGVVALEAIPGGALVGTDHGLFAWSLSDPEEEPGALAAIVGPALAVTSLSRAGDEVWVAARHACDPSRGLVVRASVDLTASEPINAIVPLDLAGLGIDPHVSLVRALSGGDLLVSTLVADTAWRELTPPSCRETLDPRSLSTEAWIVPADGGPAARL